METGGGERTVGSPHARTAYGHREVRVQQLRPSIAPVCQESWGRERKLTATARFQELQMNQQPERLPGSWGGVAKEREGMSKESSKQIALGSPPPSLQALLDLGDGDGGPNLEAGVEDSSVPIERKGICLHQPTRERDPCWGPQGGCGFQQGRSPCPQDRGC